MRKSDSEFKYLGSCPMCNSKFEPRMSTIINRHFNATHIYAQCTKCKSSVSVFVKKNIVGFVTTVGMLTDMTKEDIYKLKTIKPLSADDIIEFHQTLES